MSKRGTGGGRSKYCGSS